MSASRPAPLIETEIEEPVLECTPAGRLNRSAVGWSRRPLHRCNLRGSWGRKKRWEYWCVTTDTHLLSLTYADCDYLGVASVLFLEYATRRCIEKSVLVPFALGFRQPQTVGGSDIELSSLGLRLAMLERDGGTRLRARFEKRRGHRLDADIWIERPPDHETLNVLVPWSDDRFQFTSKQNTLPASGTVTVDGRDHRFDADNNAFGCLDFGRGIWPYRTIWNWGSASGTQGSHVVGLQLGGQWTDGTGVTENGLCIDGRLTKISEPVAFRYDRRDFTRPWRVETEGSRKVALDFVPFFEKPGRIDLAVIGAELHLCFGHFTGTVIDARGESIAIRNLMGWCEEMRARW